MKRIVSILAIATLAVAGTIPAKAQKKGDFWIGGGISMDSFEKKVFADTDTNFSVAPELGYAFSDRWAVGVILEFGKAKSYTNLLIDSYLAETISLWGIAPFARYTALKWRVISVFVDGGVSYIKQRNSIFNSYGNISNSPEETSDILGVFCRPGVSLYLSKHISLTGRIDFFNACYKNVEADSESMSDNSFIGNGFAFDINSPFNLNNFTVGLNFSF